MSAKLCIFMQTAHDLGNADGPSVLDAGSAEQLAAAELALSATLVRYASDLRGGRALPTKIERDPRIRPLIDPVQILTAAADAPDPTTFVDSLAPADSIYLGLRQTLARYRALAAAGGWPQLPEGPNLGTWVDRSARGDLAPAAPAHRRSGRRCAGHPPSRLRRRRSPTPCAASRSDMACRPTASSTSRPEPCSIFRYRTASGRFSPTWKGRAGCPTISATRTSSSTSRISLCKSSRAAAMSSACASSSAIRRRSRRYSATRSATSRSIRTGTCRGASPSRRSCLS